MRLSWPMGQNEFGQRGQFLGVTLTGTVVIRWQRYAKFERDDARANQAASAVCENLRQQIINKG